VDCLGCFKCLVSNGIMLLDSLGLLACFGFTS
jgi:hypothetical protein